MLIFSRYVEMRVDPLATESATDFSEGTCFEAVSDFRMTEGMDRDWGLRSRLIELTRHRDRWTCFQSCNHLDI